MTLHEQIAAIQTLLIYKNELVSKGRTVISQEHQQLLKQVYISIYHPATMNLGCSTCVNHYLAMLQAFFDRESPKVNQPQAEEKQVEEQAAIKPKRKKKSDEKEAQTD